VSIQEQQHVLLSQLVLVFLTINLLAFLMDVFLLQEQPLLVLQLQELVPQLLLDVLDGQL